MKKRVKARGDMVSRPYEKIKVEKIVDLERVKRWSEERVPSSVSVKKRIKYRKSNLYNQKISLYKGDITYLRIDAIVNAANESLLGGGNGKDLDAIMHKRAGKGLLEECRTLDGCDVGFAKVTGGHKLPAKYIIHAVGPCGRETPQKSSQLKSCYESILKIVGEREDIRTVALSCISTGVFGFKATLAAKIALETTRKWMKNNHESVDSTGSYTTYKRQMSSEFFPL